MLHVTLVRVLHVTLVNDLLQKYPTKPLRLNRILVSVDIRSQMIAVTARDLERVEKSDAIESMIKLRMMV